MPSGYICHSASEHTKAGGAGPGERGAEQSHPGEQTAGRGREKTVGVDGEGESNFLFLHMTCMCFIGIFHRFHF